jgi:hypothetical protein
MFFPALFCAIRYSLPLKQVEQPPFFLPHGEPPKAQIFSW